MFERRLKTLFALLTFVALVLIVRAFGVQVMGRAHWEEEAKSAMEDQTTVPTTRGRILDVKGRELAVDVPCIDLAVDYRAILLEPEPKWTRNLSRERLKKRDENFSKLSRTKRSELIDAEIEVVKREIEAMWRALAKLSGQTVEEMDEQRRQIIRLVETRRRIVWFNKYERATKRDDDQNSGGAWYSWLLGDSSQNVDIDKFDVQVAEQTQKHTILPNVDYAVRNQLEREIEKYPGMELQAGIVRAYPYQSIACHAIGTLRAVDQKEMVDKETRSQQTLEERLRNYHPSDRTGRDGLEAMLEDQLRGTRGVKIAGSMGEVVREIKAQPGKDVRTSIDVVLQASIEETFKKVPFSAYADAPVDDLAMPGAAVVIDIKSGQVRALASYPTFDLNKFDELYPKLVKDRINRPFTNRATMTALEPGSTVKPLIGLAAISERIIGPQDTIECSGYLVIRGKKYTDFGRCWTMSLFKIGHHQVPSRHPHPTGFLTYADALERSCNVYFETLGDKLGVQGIGEWFGKFGLGKPTGVGLPEASGLLPDTFDGPASQERTVSWFSAIGQGQIAATPIQMANVAATIARSGIWKRPTLLADGPATESRDLHVNREALIEVKRGMTNVVSGGAGTGTAAKMSEFPVAAKTGSAQAARLTVERRSASGELMRDAKDRVIFDKIALGTHAAPNPVAPWYRAIGETESKVSSHAWMIAFAPADDPKIAVAVMIEYGGGGGTAAGTVIHRILEAALEQGYLPTK